MPAIRAAFLIFLCAFALSAQSAAAPLTIDKEKLAEYISYAEGFTPSVKITIEDPAPTPLAGYYRLVVHLSLGDTKQDKIYHLTADGKHLIGEPLWDLTQSPFAAIAPLIPTDGPSFGPGDAKIMLVVF